MTAFVPFTPNLNFSLKKELKDRIFVKEWLIKNWWQLVKNETDLLNTNTEIQCQAENLEYAKFMVGFTSYHNGSTHDARFYWKLLSKHHLLHNLETKFVIGIVRNDDEGSIGAKYESQSTADIGKTVETERQVWGLASEWGSTYVKSVTNSVGSMKINIKITLSNVPDPEYFLTAMKLRNECKNEFSQNLTAILDDKSSCDVKILTKDSILLFAHKLIVHARCPAFTSTFESDTGLWKVDISAKTMNIILKYWYSGELLPSWRDSDVVGELLYAAGKYQMTKVLEILDDDYSGLDFQASDGDVKLLKMLHSFSLRNAEAKILKRVVSKISGATSGVELFNMLSMSIDKLDEKSVAAFQLLQSFNDALSNSGIDSDKKACFNDVILIALACKFGMKNAENQLLKLIIDTASKFKSSEELFEIFDIQNESQLDETKSLIE